MNISPLNEVVFKYLDFRGKTPLKIGMEWGGGEILALSANNVVMGGINKDKEAYYGSESLYYKWMNKGICERGDILLTMEAPLGNVAQIPDDKKYILSQRVILVKLRKGIVSPDYIFHLFMGDEFQRNLIKHSTGSTVTGIQQKKLDKIIISYPSLKKQQKIAKILTTIDQLIEKTQALINKHTAIKQGMMADLFTRGIDLTTGQLRPPVEQAPHLYKETELGWIPKDWDIKRFEDITVILTCGVAATPVYVDASQGIPFLSAQNVNNGKVKLVRYSHIPASLHQQLTKYSKPQKGDILYSRVGAGFGKAAVVEFDWEFSVYVSLTLIRMKSRYDNYFYKYLLNTQQVKNKASIDVFQGGGVPNLNVKVVREFNLPVPIFDEQKLIADQLLSIDNKIEKERVYLKKLNSQKNGLMQDLLTGKVSV